MIAILLYVAAVVYAAMMLRAKPAQRAASIIAIAGGDATLARLWPVIGPHYRTLKDVFARVSREQHIPASLLAGIAWVESDFVPTAHNASSGASGLMQVMPAHFATYGLTGDRWQDPYANITAGAKILRASGYGKTGISHALANYGGYVTTDPGPYVRKVLSRASFIALNTGDA